MAIAAGDVVIPNTYQTAPGAPAFGVVLDEPAAGTFDVLWESGRESASPIPAVGLRKLASATVDEKAAGGELQVVRLAGAPQEVIFLNRSVFRVEDDAGGNVEVIALLEQVDRNGALTGSKLIFNAGPPAGAIAAFEANVAIQPGAKWPRY